MRGTDCYQQRVFEEAEASFRSQIQLLEEDLAREKVNISCERIRTSPADPPAAAHERTKPTLSQGATTYA